MIMIMRILKIITTYLKKPKLKITLAIDRKTKKKRKKDWVLRAKIHKLKFTSRASITCTIRLENNFMDLNLAHKDFWSIGTFFFFFFCHFYHSDLENVGSK